MIIGTRRIGFIGAGNMASALIRGLLSNGCAPGMIRASDPDAGQRRKLADTGIELLDDNSLLLAESDLLVVAVKPQVVSGILETARSMTPEAQPLVISVVAGVRMATLAASLRQSRRLVRAMPNTPALVAVGATGLFGQSLEDGDRQLVEDFFKGVGLCLWLETEQLLDAVTAVSGSGPAYFFLLMEAMIDAGKRLGLSATQARLLTVQTAAGAAAMAAAETCGLRSLREKVTSPGGTTAAAVETLYAGRMPQLVDQALNAACMRAGELGELSRSVQPGELHVARSGKRTP